MKRKQRKSLPWRRFGNVILIIIKFCELLLRISPRIINSLRSYVKHSKECFLLFPNTSKLVKKTRQRLVFPTYFSVFGNRRKHSFLCLIYYMKHLGSLESTQEARVALGYASSNSYAFFVLSKLPACFISRWSTLTHESIVKYKKNKHTLTLETIKPSSHVFDSTRELFSIECETKIIQFIFIRRSLTRNKLTRATRKCEMTRVPVSANIKRKNENFEKKLP